MPHKSKFRIIASHVCHNYAHKLRFLAGRIESEKGATHRELSLERSLGYIEEVFADYLAYSGLSLEDLAGRRVLEIGPGDNLGVALRLLAAGCSQVVCLDKFFAQRDELKQLAIYRALRDSLTPRERERFDQAVSLEHGFHPNPERLEYRCGISIESAGERFAAGSFDLIVSRAVLMELPDSDAGFAAMDRLLGPGGWMIHKVAPLQDYKMFQAYGYSPLEFLTIPGWLYRPMVSDCGGPNRRPVTYYRRKMAELAYLSTIHIVNLIGARLKLPPGTTNPPPELPEYRNALRFITEIRPRLRPEFQALDAQDLAVEDVFLVARKPGGPEMSARQLPQTDHSMRAQPVLPEAARRGGSVKDGGREGSPRQSVLPGR